MRPQMKRGSDTGDLICNQAAKLYTRTSHYQNKEIKNINWCPVSMKGKLREEADTGVQRGL